MNIDIVNSLKKLMTVCEAVEADQKTNIIRDVIDDIFRFIYAISLKNGKQRCEYFSKVYLNSEDINIKFDEFNDRNKPFVSLVLFCDSDETIFIDNTVKASQVLISFFVTVGKEYVTNGAERKNTDLERYTSLLNEMNKYVDSRKSAKIVASTGATETESKEIMDISEEATTEEEQEESLEELITKLNSLIGLNDAKREVEQIINLIKVQKKGEEFGEKLPPLSLHLVFYGNPGTGKTTVARLIAKIYKSLGVLSKGQFVEVDRSGLVAGYVGQTAIKTQEAIDKAMGGVLFIDEAYALTHGKGENDFGQETVDTILKAMEDYRDDFIVIVAGYPDLMKEFIASNPGLKSRFNKFINFEDYSADELMKIFRLQCNEQNLQIEEKCEPELRKYFEDMYNNRGADYANGRDVRNFFENVFKARANRIADKLDGITHEEYITITAEDIKESVNMKTVF